MRIVRFDARPILVPLREPFVIANARVDVTRSVLVHVRLVKDEGLVRKSAFGIGEAAALPGVTTLDQPDVLRHLSRAEDQLLGASFDGHSALEALLDNVLGHDTMARAGAEHALLDAWARLEDVPAHALLGSPTTPPEPLHTDITIPMVSAQRAAELATWWWAMGFRAFKVKVGKNVDDDARNLEAIARATPHAELRLDGNEGLTGRAAMTLLSITRRLNMNVTCFEQPCARNDEEGMAFVTELAGCPVIADESVQNFLDLERVLKKRTARGVNLKLQKMGGAVKAGRLGRAAKRRGLLVMMGAMVETRLGLSMSAHLVHAMGGADFIDLDTALLLKGDPFVGGYTIDGPTMQLVDGAGVTVSESAQA